jgi:branched-chain amino acid transport system substrate-binding protein
MKVSLCLAGLTAIGLLLTGCGGSASKTDAATPYTVCADESLSGVYAAYDVPQLAGLKVAIYEVNQSGGLLGRQVKLSYLDDQSDVTRAPQVAQQLLGKNKCVAMFINSSSTISGSILPFTTAAKVISYSAVVTPTFGDPKKYPYHFMTGPESDKQINAFVAAVKKIGATKVGLLHTNDTGNTTLSTALAKALPAAGLTVADTESVDATATDLNVQISKIRKSGADLVLVQASAPATAVAVKAADSIGWKVNYLVSTAATNATNMENVPASLKDGYYTLAPRIYLATGSPSPTLTKFTNDLKATGQITDINQAVSARDAIQMIFQAVKQAGTTDSGKVAKVLQGIGSANLPDGVLLSAPNPGYTATDHSMNNADFSQYWALLRPGTLDPDGHYNGEELTVNYSSGS